MGLKGVLVGGTTGEGYSLTTLERIAVLDRWAATDAVKSGRLSIIAMVSSSAHPDTIQLARHAKSLNVRALMIQGHSYWNHSSVSDLVDYLHDISLQTQFYPLIY